MDGSLVSSRKGLTVSSLASIAPVVALLGTDKLPIYTIAILQILTIFLVQFLSVFIKFEGKGRGSKEEVKKVVEPIKVQVVKNADESTTAAESEQDEGLTPIKKKRNRMLQESKKARKAKALQSELAVSDVQGDPSVGEAAIEPTNIKLPNATPLATPKFQARIIEEHALYSNAVLDDCLRNFLAVLEPIQLTYMSDAPDPSTLPAPVPLSNWVQLLHTPTSQVAKHPTIPHLYSIAASYPDVPIRNLWELLIDITNRPKWDNMCQITEELESIGLDQSHGATRQGNVTYMATKSMFPVKANDMVLLSLNARLRPTDGPVRLVCATTSVEHPLKPIFRGYSRMQLGISGFLAEDDGLGGSRVIQVTDLSALGSWVPARIIKMVTETMIPRSLEKIATAAKAYELSGPRTLLKGDDWLPPVIGTWDVPTSPSSTSTLVDPAEDITTQGLQSSTSSSITLQEPHEGESTSTPNDGEETDDVSDGEKVPASASRDIKELVLQLRAVNKRLAHLEQASATSSPAPSAHVKSSPSTPIERSGEEGAPGSFRPPPTPFGVNRVTGNALSPVNTGGPMGWMSRLASNLSLSNFVGGLGAGIFSTTTAATLAAILVYYIRWKRR